MEYANDTGISPPFTEENAKSLAEELNNEVSHRHARHVLMIWIEKEYFNENNASLFFLLLESCLSYYRKLKEQGKECVEKLENPVCPKVQQDLNSTEKLFRLIGKQDIWESFTPSQKMNIQMMKLDLLDLNKNIYSNNSGNVDKEKGSTRFQSEADELKMQIFNLKHKLSMACKEAKVLEEKYRENVKDILNLKFQLQSQKQSREQESPVEAATKYNSYDAHMNEMQILSFITIVLYENLSGLNIDSIYSHLKKSTISNVKKQDINFVLRKYPHFFKEADKKWLYIGLRI